MDIDQIKALRNKKIKDDQGAWDKVLLLRALTKNDFKNKGYLSFNKFKKILKWKYAGQDNKIEKILAISPVSLIESITRCYAEIDHPNEELKTRIKTYILLGIPWIGIGMASTIMGLHEPEKYAGIDKATWATIFQEEERTLQAKDYLPYLKRMKEIAMQLDCDLQETEYLLKLMQDLD